MCLSVWNYRRVSLVLMIAHHPLSWWIKMLDEPFSLARFGDGEFLCMSGRKGGNSHGCAYTPALQQDLLAITNDMRKGLYKGMQRITPDQHAQVRPFLDNGEWVDTEIFADAIAEGKMKAFFDKLRTLRVVLVSSKEKRSVSSIIPIHEFIETPRTNTHAVKDEIVQHILSQGTRALYLFACGMAAGTLVHALHGKISGASFLDIGHIFDPFIGEASREYLLSIDPVILKRNIL